MAEDDETVVTRMGTAESVRTATVPSRSCGKLLVVDDDPEVRGMLSRLLEVEGYKVTEAMTGAEAIGSLTNDQPDLVILDVMLTTEDGFDVLAAIRRTSDVPVILVTAKGHESDRVLGLKLGADDYVVKPFSPAELAARVGTVLRRSGSGRRSASSNGTLEFGDLLIDTMAREIRVSERAGRDHGQGVRPAGLPGGLATPGLHPGTAAGPGVGLLLGMAGRRHRDRAHPPYPAQDRGGSRQPPVGPHRAGRGLPLRALTQAPVASAAEVLGHPGSCDWGRHGRGRDGPGARVGRA